MNAFIESLKRLYSTGVINVSDIDRLYAGKKITAEERDYILASA